jgi:hypothetical protein
MKQVNIGRRCCRWVLLFERESRMKAIQAGHYTPSELYEFLDDIYSMEVHAQADWLGSREEALIQFQIQALNILGEPYELSVYRTHPNDGLVMFGVVGPNIDNLCDIPVITFSEAFAELKRLMRVRGEIDQDL